MTASVACPICGGGLEVRGDDLRGEWERIDYYCSDCDDIYTRLITFQTQSSMVASDEWEGIVVGPRHVVMHYNDLGGSQPITTILEVSSLDDNAVREVIADYLIEEHDFDIEEVIDNKDSITYFRIDSKVVGRLQDVVWPESLTPIDTGVGDPPTGRLVEAKLAVYSVFKMDAEG